MVYIGQRADWNLPERAATPESAYLSRRSFLSRAAATAGVTALAGCGPLAGLAGRQGARESPYSDIPLPPYTRNPDFADAGRPLTAEGPVYTYNNFYEFGYDKTSPHIVAKDFKIDPYTLRIDGLVEQPLELDLDEVEHLGIEERVYRFRCVEAWAMTVPWLGVPLAALLKRAQPLPEARYVAFKSFLDPVQAPNQRRREYDWPYYEGLQLDEAMNELSFVATGLYGKRLLPQNGCPLRVVVPWKYGYKGPKSVVRITLTAGQPPTFWSDVAPHEYPFESNVDPRVAHPRWPQNQERLLGSEDVVDTQIYNGYGAWVSALYA